MVPFVISGFEDCCMHEGPKSGKTIIFSMPPDPHHNVFTCMGNVYKLLTFEKLWHTSLKSENVNRAWSKLNYSFTLKKVHLQMSEIHPPKRGLRMINLQNLSTNVLYYPSPVWPIIPLTFTTMHLTPGFDMMGLKLHTQPVHTQLY